VFSLRYETYFKNDVYYFESLNNVTRKPVFGGSQVHVGFVVDKVRVGDVFFSKCFHFTVSG